MHLDWSRSNFSDFCINLLSTLEGLPFDDIKRPSFGRVFDRVERKKARPQDSTGKPGSPFIAVKLHAGGSNGEKMLVNNEEELPTIEFWVEVENKGDVEAKGSDDMFKSSCTLLPGQRAIKPVKFVATIDDKSRRLEDLLNAEGLELPYRLVYQATQGNEEFVAVEKIVKISGRDISLV